MVYGEYRVDWRFRDRVPLCTQVYSGRNLLRKPPKKKTGGPLTPGCHLGGEARLSPNPRFSNPPSFLARIGFLTLTTIQHHRLLTMEYCAYKVEKKAASAPVWLYTSLLEPTTSTSRMPQNQSQSIYFFFLIGGASHKTPLVVMCYTPIPRHLST